MSADVEQDLPRRPVVVITGASAGIGRAAVRAFAAAGYDVGLVARGQDGLEAAQRDVDARGGQSVVYPADVADPEAVEAAAETIERDLGPIDVWVNDAMTSVFAPVEELAPDEVRRVTEVTYLGAVYGTMAALRRMGPRDAGTIVQVGSALAYRSIPLQAAYCGAKSALRGFTDSLRTELIHDHSKVRLTMVHLPAVNTPQFRWVRSRLPLEAQPVPPIYQPEVAAEAIVWAARHPRRELLVGLPTVLAIYANRVVPGLMDHYMAYSAWDGQLTEEPRDESRPDNLYEPVAGDPGAHGVFDRRAHVDSSQLWADTHRPLIGVAMGTAALLLVRLGLARSRGH